MAASLSINNLFDGKIGNLTPLGQRVIALYNDYTSAGLNSVAASQLIGGQLVEDPRLSAWRLG
jgi:hypothetical protein